MQETVDALEVEMQNFIVEARKAIAGNKSAGQRSRKAIKPMTDLMKKWRKVSIPA